MLSQFLKQEGLKNGVRKSQVFQKLLLVVLLLE